MNLYSDKNFLIFFTVLVSTSFGWEWLLAPVSMKSDFHNDIVSGGREIILSIMNEPNHMDISLNNWLATVAHQLISRDNR